MADLKQTQEKPPEDSKSTVVTSTKSKSSNKTLIIVLVIVGVFLVLPGILIAAGGYWLSRGDNAKNITERAIENATGADVVLDKDGSSVNIKTDKGSVSYGTEQKLPDNLPADVVMYDGQTIVGVISTTQDESSMWNISAETDDSASDVNKFIKSKYEEKGWKSSSQSTYNDTTLYTYEKDKLTATISVGPAGDASNVSVSYSIRETK